MPPDSSRRASSRRSSSTCPARRTATDMGLLATARRDLATGRFERTLSALTAAGAAVTAGEIYLSHDKASFGNRMMWWPVAVVPAAVPAGIAAGFSPRAAQTGLPPASAALLV